MCLSVIHAAVAVRIYAQLGGRFDPQCTRTVSNRVISLNLFTGHIDRVNAGIFSGFPAQDIVQLIRSDKSLHGCTQFRIRAAVCLRIGIGCHFRRPSRNPDSRLCFCRLIIRMLCPDVDGGFRRIDQNRMLCTPVLTVGAEGNPRIRDIGCDCDFMRISVIDSFISAHLHRKCSGRTNDKVRFSVNNRIIALLSISFCMYPVGAGILARFTLQRILQCICADQSFCQSTQLRIRFAVSLFPVLRRDAYLLRQDFDFRFCFCGRVIRIDGPDLYGLFSRIAEVRLLHGPGRSVRTVFNDGSFRNINGSFRCMIHAVICHGDILHTDSQSVGRMNHQAAFTVSHAVISGQFSGCYIDAVGSRIFARLTMQLIRRLFAFQEAAEDGCQLRIIFSVCLFLLFRKDGCGCRYNLQIRIAVSCDIIRILRPYLYVHLSRIPDGRQILRPFHTVRAPGDNGSAVYGRCGGRIVLLSVIGAAVSGSCHRQSIGRFNLQNAVPVCHMIIPLVFLAGHINHITAGVFPFITAQFISNQVFFTGDNAAEAY